MKKCNVCKDDKDLTAFHKMTCAPDGLAYTCKECNKKCYNKLVTETLRGRLSRLCASARQRSKLKKYDFDLTVDILKKMWNSQEGKCAYSGQPMNLVGNWQASLERKDPTKGYTQDNTCLICLELNGRDQWTPEKVEYFRNLPKGQEVDYTNEVIKSYRFTSIHEGKMNLLHLRQKMYAAKMNAKAWTTKKKNRNMVDTIFDLNLERLVQILKDQKGLCAYSGIELGYGTGNDLSLSIERLDPRKGYYPANIAFVCKIFNVGDHRVQSDQVQESYPSWSKEKCEIFLKK